MNSNVPLEFAPIRDFIMQTIISVTVFLNLFLSSTSVIKYF